jgi:hypothetical protein
LSADAGAPPHGSSGICPRNGGEGLKPSSDLAGPPAIFETARARLEVLLTSASAWMRASPAPSPRRPLRTSSERRRGASAGGPSSASAGARITPNRDSSVSSKGTRPRERRDGAAVTSPVSIGRSRTAPSTVPGAPFSLGDETQLTSRIARKSAPSADTPGRDGPCKVRLICRASASSSSDRRPENRGVASSILALAMSIPLGSI